MYWKNLENGQDLLVLEKGEEALSTITDWARENNIGGLSLSGIGAVKDVEVGFYDLEKKEYLRKKFDQGDFELITFQGNVSQKQGDYYTHVHGSFSDETFHVFGGHFFSATVAVTMELCAWRLGAFPKRETNAQIGLDLICGVV